MLNFINENFKFRMEGAVDSTELLRRLRTVIKDNEICLIAARAERMERSFNQTLRAQQDEAYQESLRADQEKERHRVAERKKVEELESMKEKDRRGGREEKTGLYSQFVAREANNVFFLGKGEVPYKFFPEFRA